MVSKNNLRSNIPKGVLGQLRISLIEFLISPFDCPGDSMTRSLYIIRFYKRRISI